ncbi:hypothetical protein F4859DRAFT_61639 [Xylaria cf. heliscus]|nr:hypothetical protein F4859DRAFT_61639 [Xylaria cf. heliscus]
MSGGWRDRVDNVVKKGWHPEKPGTTLKNQVKGLVGRGDSSSPREQHVAAPRSSLRDPSSFGPPPKHFATYGRTATAQTQEPTAGAATSYAPTQSPAAGPTQPYQAQHVVEEEQPAEPRPYRVDTTGLSTSHLPPPPARSSGTGGRAPQSPVPFQPAPTSTTQPLVTTKPRVPPSLPPRLPPRGGNSTPSPTITHEQAVIQGHLNQGAIDRLGAAGISVPGLGIGGGRTPPPPPGARFPPPSTGSSSQAPGYGQVDGELQARFARMGASSPAQTSSHDTAAADGTQQRPIGQVPSVVGKKKPPPPPIPKKPGLSRTRAENDDAPPPVPLATRPRFD